MGDAIEDPGTRIEAPVTVEVEGELVTIEPTGISVDGLGQEEDSVLVELNELDDQVEVEIVDEDGVTSNDNNVGGSLIYFQCEIQYAV